MDVNIWRIEKKWACTRKGINYEEREKKNNSFETKRNKFETNKVLLKENYFKRRKNKELWKERNAKVHKERQSKIKKEK